jgi:hypothetical protein
MTFNELMSAVLVLLPDATFYSDTDGEIVISTNLRYADGSQDTAGNEQLVSLEEGVHAED